MNDARKRAAGLLPAALLAAACIALAPAHAAYATDYHWIGAGTGGNTATDPTDPTTQWNNPANWQEAKAPGPSDYVYLNLSNAGYANAQSGTIGGFNMNGTSQEGALHIAEGVDLVSSKDWSAIVGYSGYSGPGQGRIVQTGGTFTLNGGLDVGRSGGTGTYCLEGGTLTVAAPFDEYIGYFGTGVFTQTGGTHVVKSALYVGQGFMTSSGNGVLKMGGGTLRVGGLYVGDASSTAALNITSTLPVLTADSVTFGPKSSLKAVPGAAIHITCFPGFHIHSGDESAFADLQNLALIFDGDEVLHRGLVEVAGADLGAKAAGFKGNFGIGSLTIGAVNPCVVWLYDNYDNGNRSPAEALYVHDLTIGPGSTLDLRGFNLYYDGLYDNQGTVLGGTPVFVPEPGSVMLLAFGFGIVRCLRFFSTAGGKIGTHPAA